MSQYLLSTQTVIDIALQDGGPAFRWYEEADARAPSVSAADIFISALTPGLVKQGLDKKDQTAEVVAVRLASESLIERFVAAGQVVDVTKGIANLWFRLAAMKVQLHKRNGTIKGYSAGELMVLATAIIGTDGFPYKLVARRHDGLIPLQALGLEVEDPADLYP